MAKDFIDHKIKNRDTLEYVHEQGEVEPGGTECAKKGSDLDVTGGNAQNRKQLFKVDAMGTDAAKKDKSQRKSGDHFKTTTSVEPSGTEAGKAGAGRNVG